MNNTSRIFDGFLVLHYRGGDKRALGMLVGRYHARLCRHAYWYTRDNEASRDIVQDSWQLVIKNIDSLKDPNKFGSWAMTIVTRKAVDYLNRLSRERDFRDMQQPVAFDAAEDGLPEPEQQLVRLKKAIASLVFEQREVIRLFYLENYSLLEIGKILRLPSGTVKSRLFHAREKLKSILK